MYDIRKVIETIADVHSVLELRGGFGSPMVTALGRVEGRPIGILANDPVHLGGAIDADAVAEVRPLRNRVSTRTECTRAFRRHPELEPFSQQTPA